VSEKKLRAVSKASPPAARVEGEEGERSEPGAPGARAAGAAAGQPPTPDPEVPQKAKRRRFAAAYKLKILKRADALDGTGEIGAMLRREGLYSSMLSKWREQRDAGALRGLKPRKRGPVGLKSDPLAKENKQLRREVAQLQGRLKQAEIVIDIQKKASELLGIPLRTLEDEESDL
jgi:transposase-like protein